MVFDESIAQGANLAEVVAMPDNHGFSWYTTGGNLATFLKYVDDAGDNSVRVGVYSPTFTTLRTFRINYGSITYGAGTTDVGETGLRFNTIYLVNSPDVSSDETKKDQVGELTESEKAAAIEIARLPRVFRWISEQEEKEGTDKTVSQSRSVVDYKPVFSWV